MGNSIAINLYENWLEPRIDLLVELRKEGLLNEGDYQKKLDLVIDEYHNKIISLTKREKE